MNTFCRIQNTVSPALVYTFCTVFAACVLVDWMQFEMNSTSTMRIAQNLPNEGFVSTALPQYRAN